MSTFAPYNTAAVQFIKLPSEEREGGDHGWLKAFHTFSPSSYVEKGYNQWGCLRIMNEDRIEPHTGFGTHPHREFEIFTYIVSGESRHDDSLGNTEILKRGDVQMTSTGTGIRHSEKTDGEKQVHLMQMWAIPETRGLKPQYYTRHFTDEEKTNRWALIVAPVSSASTIPNFSLEREAESGPTPIHSQLSMFASLISPSVSLTYTITPSSSTPSTSSQPRDGRRKLFIHIVQSSGYNPGKPKGRTVRVSSKEAGSVELTEGDGLFILGKAGEELRVENSGEGVAEVLLFEMDS